MGNENTGITIKINIPSFPQLLAPRHCGRLEDTLLHFYKNRE